MGVITVAILAILLAFFLILLMGKKPKGYPEEEMITREDIEEDRVTFRQKKDKDENLS